MKRALAISAAAALAALAASAAVTPALLAPPKYGDPTRMYVYACSNVADVATVFFPDDTASNFTALVWAKWHPRAEVRQHVTNETSQTRGMLPLIMANVSADPARATREGGDELAHIGAWDETEPLPLVNGGWAAANCLPATYDYPQSLAGSRWQYGCYCINIMTDAALTLNVGGEEKNVPASPDMQVFNIQAASQSRAVSVAAADPAADVFLGIAENPLVQFVGAQFCSTDSHRGFSREDGGIDWAEWRMVVVRGRIASGSLTVEICGYNATSKFPHEESSTKTLWHPRTTFARNARLRMGVASVLGGIGAGTDDPDVFEVYGLKVYAGLLDDATVERMRDLDAAEMSRRGM